MNRARTKRTSSGWLVVLACIALAVPPTLYSGVYVYARVTHKLVNYGSFVGRPHAHSGIGYSAWEIVFLPATWLEEEVRGVFGI